MTNGTLKQTFLAVGKYTMTSKPLLCIPTTNAIQQQMIRLVFVILMSFSLQGAFAQPAARRQQQHNTATGNADNVSLRARISFPTQSKMDEDVVWRRDIYRELKTPTQHCTIPLSPPTVA